mmetsp:Transcript_8286/g.19358  ORF Transcript_8286/g.19358 Transcript_8286/m.19358 type:complete len:101 (+) Transcript_8286:579-881(+)
MGRRSRSRGWSEIDEAVCVDSLVAVLARLDELPWIEILTTTVFLVSALLLSTMISSTMEPMSFTIANGTRAMQWSAAAQPMTAASRPITSAWGLVHGKGM